ncbi:PTS system fructose-specific IIA component [Alkalihalobacillus xiaoxiensis]|uniref:PTS system fructose-specific IIA component n=1 Tax=Shouchella xiaoxiensis TaxID=766895 RepID=A0ABS2SVQ2_9BACI|nr:fructose PTS transporter subunit IIA [Shouchella xiaoxiensis]MBM7839564.1 PTS system fructose-specific IIA component [Shouchella xiaoxiensis]
MITQNQIYLHSTAKTQEEVFTVIAELALQNGIASSVEGVITGLNERELQSSTGFQDGFAIPHTQADAIKKPGIVVVRTEQGIEWNSFDDQPAFFFISLLIPKEEAGSTHLKALASLSSALMDDEKRDGFLHSQTELELSKKINLAIMGDDN